MAFLQCIKNIYIHGGAQIKNLIHPTIQGKTAMVIFVIK